MAKKSKSINLKNSSMNFPSKLLFTFLFFLMGFSIVGAGLKGQEATAPIIVTIGMLMILIGLAPWYVPLIYKNYVNEKIITASAS
jgi:hypothetical protein